MKNQTKKKEFVDLHLHSNKSDGKLSPKEIIDEAVQLGLKAIAITDHDTIEGSKEAIKHGKGKLEVVPGVEINCYEKEKGFPEIHVLGYLFNPEAKPINEILQKASEERFYQKEKLVENLQKMGYDISIDEVLQMAGGEVSRAHVAQILLKKYPDEFSSIPEVFEKYIGTHCPAYVERVCKSTVNMAVEAIIKSGGIAVLAHPGAYKDKDAIELIKYFTECGGKGLEIWYPYEKIFGHEGVTKEDEKRKITLFKKIAQEKNLLMTGGSDFHSVIRNTQINEMKIPYSVVEKLKKAQKKREI
ncbi:MAG: PHP domain-containing protein [Nanoarchaeota archaeon]|nr:PHP domain-containing protein [Nanoarchaeota archaeon]MBU1321061.1 PHP domain-containing protein [Nanoarchaeota archaeon]MBU1597067.1 PHP domain-containing protein [Nanoarchaeota archaeon]MBU2440857.1 PHP domain-containing protein [Nanoarchaeota archaeon]